MTVGSASTFGKSTELPSYSMGSSPSLLSSAFPTKGRVRTTSRLRVFTMVSAMAICFMLLEVLISRELLHETLTIEVVNDESKQQPAGPLVANKRIEDIVSVENLVTKVLDSHPPFVLSSTVAHTTPTVPQPTSPPPSPSPSPTVSISALKSNNKSALAIPFDRWLYASVGDRVDRLKSDFEDRISTEEAKTGSGEQRGSYFSNFSRPIITSYTCDGTLEGDYDNPDHPDCSVLIQDFGASCAGGGVPRYPTTIEERLKRSPADISAALPQISHDVVTDPYEQGYLIVPGLTDPAIVAAAAYDEHRRIEQKKEIRFPLVGVEAFIENPNRRGPHTHPSAIKRAFRRERSRLQALGMPVEKSQLRKEVEEKARRMNAEITNTPITIDVVYTYVNADEPRFKNDLQYYEKWNEPKPKKLSFEQKRDRFNAYKRARFAHPLPLSVMWETVVRALPSSFTDGLLELQSAGNESCENPTQMSELFGKVQSDFREFVEESVTNVSSEANDLLARPFALSPTKRSKLFSNHNQRYRDYNEIMYSLRSLYRHLLAPVERVTRVGPFAAPAAAAAAGASDDNPPNREGAAAPPLPSTKNIVGISNNFGNIYIVVCNKDQAPSWLQTWDDVNTVNATGHRVPSALLRKVRMVEHAEVFPNATRSLPNFNSNSIDTVLHRIKGLGRHFIFMNNDYFTTRPVSFFDYFMPVVVGGEVRFVTKPAPERTMPAVAKPSIPTFFDSPGLTANFFGSQKASMFILKNVMTPNATTIPYVLAYGHYIHLFDRLHLLRMFTEQPARELLCDGRGQRKRGRHAPLINIMALYYSMWYLFNRNATLVDAYHFRFGLGDVGNMTALRELPVVLVGGKTPNEGKVLTTLWAHLYPQLDTLPKVLAHTLNQTAVATSPQGFIQVYATDIIDVKRSAASSQWATWGDKSVEGRAFFSVTIADDAVLDEPLNRKITRTRSGWHWILNAMSATVGLYPELHDTDLYRFSPSVTKVHVRRYRDDYLANRGKLLSVCVNDELPTTRDVPHYSYNMSQLLIREVCMNYDNATMAEFVHRFPHVFADTVRRYRAGGDNRNVEFNVTEWASVALDMVIDEGLGNVAEPRWTQLLGNLSASPPCVNEHVNRTAFSIAVAERIQAACVLGVAHEQLALLRYSVGGEPDVGEVGRVRTYVDERYLLADATDLVYGGVYGAEYLLESLHILSEGTPESLYRNLTPPWEKQ